MVMANYSEARFLNGCVVGRAGLMSKKKKISISKKKKKMKKKKRVFKGN